jgi:hypothetical protein
LLQCYGSGSGIRCLFDLWIRNPGWVKHQDLDPGSVRAYKQFLG